MSCDPTPPYLWEPVARDSRSRRVHTPPEPFSTTLSGSVHSRTTVDRVGPLKGYTRRRGAVDRVGGTESVPEELRALYIIRHKTLGSENLPLLSITWKTRDEGAVV